MDKLKEAHEVMELMALDIRKRNPELKDWPLILICNLYYLKNKKIKEKIVDNNSSSKKE